MVIGVGLINEVNQHQVLLVLGWVTVFGWVDHLGIVTSQLGRLSLPTLRFVGKMRTTFGWEGNGMVHTVRG